MSRSGHEWPLLVMFIEDKVVDISLNIYLTSQMYQTEFNI